MPLTPFFRVVPAFIWSVVAAGALGACSSQGYETTWQVAAPALAPPQPARPAAAPLINLPAALHLRPAEFSRRFGHTVPLAEGFVDPGKAVVEKPVPTDSQALFRPRGLPMVVSFHNGTVSDVLLLGSDEATLMGQATLQPDAAGYLLLPVFVPRHSERLLGLRVVPK